MKDLSFDKLVVFSLGKESYTVPIESVQEIIRPQTITHVPKSPDFMEGVINLRGKIIPIIDGRKRFAINSNETFFGKSRIIVLEFLNQKMGLTVDSVKDVVYLNRNDIKPVPMQASDKKFIKGFGIHNEKLLIILDLANLLKVNEIESVKCAVRKAENISNFINTLVEN